MPKILFINSSVNHGSTGRIVEQLGQMMTSQGWECRAVTGARYFHESSMPLYKMGGKMSEELHAIESMALDRHGLGSYFQTKSLVRKIEEYNPDIIHLHQIHGYYLNYEVLFDYLARAGKPVVWTIHDCWPMTGHCSHFTAANCYKWKSGCFDCPRLDNYPKSYTDNSRKNYALKKQLFTSIENMTLTPVSNWLGGVVKESFLSKYPVKVIQNGIDLKVFYPRKGVQQKIREKYNLGDKYVILGVATGWNKDNGYYDFQELQKMLGKDYAVVLLGANEKQIAEMPEGMVGIKKTDNLEELAELYSTPDIFVNGSFEETFGLVIAEAMACGTPVVVYNATACPEIVTDKTGFVVPVKDLGAIKSAIENYRTMDSAIYMKNCVEYATAHFDKNEKYKQYSRLYDELIRAVCN